MRIRTVIATALAAAGLLAATALPSQAMGTGNPYLDMQVGVTYTVYQPTFTAGLKQIKVGTAPAGYGFTGDANLLAQFGKGNGRNFSIWEGNPMGMDIGQGALVGTATVMGRTAKVYAYCDPASPKKCTMGDVSRFGGHLEVTLPAALGLRETIVWIETIGKKPIAGQQLITIAKGLTPVQ